MKSQHMLLILALVVIALTSFVFFKDDILADKTPLTTDERKAVKLLKLAQQSCLSGSTENAGMKLNLDSDLANKLSLESGIAKTTSRGAVTYLDDQIRQLQDDKIRKCLEEQLPQIRACTLGDCEQANLPKLINFKFKILKPNQDNDLSLTTVRFAIQNREGERNLALQNDGYFLDSIEFFNKDTPRLGRIGFQVREAHMQRTKPIELCLKRAETVDPTLKNYTQFECHKDKGCTHNPMSPKWFERCDVKPLTRGAVISTPSNWLDDVFSAVLAPAFAQGINNVWAVPTLDTLTSRIATADLVGVGFTTFNVSADKPLGIDAQSYYFDLSVNGQPIEIDGLPGEYNVQAYAPDKPLNIDFALQNLNFSGVRNGCDELTLKLHFLKDEKLTAEALNWSRSYVALRNASEKNKPFGAAQLSWTGKYNRAPKEYDTEVFASSVNVATELDFNKYKDQIKKAKEDISTMKTNFDKAGLEFEGKTLVSVIRPPLTRISYGLAVGIVEDTGQIRFTFSNKFSTRLLNFLLEKRQEAPEYKKIIRHDAFRYSLRGDKSYSVSPPVCWDEAA
ncbi:MAG: hypothetical protein ACI965_001444 [Paraglaciecola sp.]|jgi:hypothetical protein